MAPTRSMWTLASSSSRTSTGSSACRPASRSRHEVDPSDLDERLARRGYVVDAPVDILTADASLVVCALVDVGSASARVETGIDRPWADGFADDPGVRRRIDGYAKLFAGIVPRHVAVMVDVDGAPGALGFGVTERGWLGIFGMATRRAVRRRGAARIALRTLARWAVDQGAAALYLQVEADNDAARRLYESVGFVFSHRYHYRVSLT